jgi:hypothetical protein
MIWYIYSKETDLDFWHGFSIGMCRKENTKWLQFLSLGNGWRVGFLALLLKSYHQSLVTRCRPIYDVLRMKPQQSNIIRRVGFGLVHPDRKLMRLGQGDELPERE